MTKCCPGAPLHKHEPLIGFAIDFHGNTVFKTALAQALGTEPDRKTAWRMKFADDAKADNLFSQKVEIELENEQCVGGLRSSWQSVKKVAGWAAVGRTLRRALQLCMTQVEQMSNMKSWLALGIYNAIRAGVFPNLRQNTN